MNAKDISIQTGFSLSTVMKVLGGQAEKYNISEKTRKKILETAEKTGYCRNDLAASVRTGSSRNIGLILSETEDRANMAILNSIMRTAAQEGQGISTYTENNITHAFDHMRRNKITKIISASVEKDKRYQTALLARKYKMDIVFVYEKAVEEFPAVNVDNHAGMKMATEYLFAMGHRKIRFCCGPLNYDYLIKRHAGFISALREADIPIEKDMIDLTDITDYRKYLKDLLALPSGRRPTAILTTSTSDILKFNPFITEMKLNIPEDISLFGFGDTYECRYICSGISTVQESLQKVGETAVRYIMGLPTEIKADADNVFLIPPVLSLRNSVKKIS